MTTQIKITQLVDIGANLNTTSLFPVVNMAGTPTTQKTNLGNVGNTILQGAGSTFKPAALANLAYSVANAAQPNITSIGTLTTLTVSGNTSLGLVGNVKITGGTSGYVLSTDGAGNLSWVAQTGGGSYGNSNVATFLASYGSNTITTTGNVSVGNIIGNGQALTGIAGANVTGAVSFASTANSVAAANVSGLGNLALLSKDGNASNVLHGDGSWSADLTTYGNSNVVTLLSSFGSNTISTTGNVKTGTLTVPASDNGSIVFSNNGTDTNGSLKVDGGFNMIVSANSNFYVKRAGSDRLAITDTNTDLMASSNVVIHANKAGTEKNWIFDTTGNLTLPGNIDLYGDVISFHQQVGNITWGTNYMAFSQYGRINTNVDFFANANVIGAQYLKGDGSNITNVNAVQVVNGTSNVTIPTTNGNVVVNVGDSVYTLDGTGNLTLPDGTIIGTPEGTGTTGIVATNDTSILLETSQTASTTVINWAPPQGTNYPSAGGSAYVSGGSGSGMNVQYAVSGGSVIAVSINNPGTGYQTGDILTILAGDNNAEFEVEVKDALSSVWSFGADGNTTFPTGGLITNIANYGPGLSTGLFDANGITLGTAAGNDITFTPADGVALYSNGAMWAFNIDSSLTLPTISLGESTDEQTVIQSQRKIIPPFRYSAVISGTTPTVVYTASSNNITSMKVTMQIQHTGLGMELFDVYATYVGSTETYYTVSNRVASPTIDNSTVVVDLNGSNEMQITVSINSGAATSWVTYDSTEFGIPQD
jgi:hypothetical protein